jgi:dTDP-glucose 4,6-dehydratase
MKIIVTGGLGFIGSAFVRMLEKYPNIKTVIVDKGTYASDIRRVEGCTYELIKKDICDLTLEDIGTNVDYIVNFAAESHVDRSISDGLQFVHSNIDGVFNLLEIAIKIPSLKKFIQISTDEVYGDKLIGESLTTDMLNPSSYYSASKAAADMLVKSAGRTYGLPYLITRTCNNFGDMQHPEKFIPIIMNCIDADVEIPIYGDGTAVREWIWVEDNVTEIFDLIVNNASGIAHIGSRDRWQNKELVQLMGDILGKEVKWKYAPDRLGHDKRYALKSNNQVNLTIEDYLRNVYGKEN